MQDLLVIGSIVADLVAYVTEFPLPGEVVTGSGYKIFLGGKGLNQCVAAARLGVKVSMAGMVGNDSLGSRFLELLKAERIDSEGVFVSKEFPTSVSQIQVNKAGENKIVNIPLANHEFDTSHLQKIEPLLIKSKLVMAQLELKKGVNEEIIRLCAKTGVPLILNPAPAYKFDKELYKCIDYLTPNETELHILTGMPVDTLENILKAAKELYSRGVKNVVVTLGRKGAMIFNSDGGATMPGFKVKAVDTVAAGDTFNGALAKAILDGKPLKEAVRFANAAGALAVTKVGAIPSLPKLDEVLAFVNKTCAESC